MRYQCLTVDLTATSVNLLQLTAYSTQQVLAEKVQLLSYIRT